MGQRVKSLYVKFRRELKNSVGDDEKNPELAYD